MTESLAPGTNTSLKLVVRSSIQEVNGNDVAIDDISVFQSSTACLTEVNFPFIVNSEVDIVTVTNNTGVLTADQTGTGYQWYKCPNTLLVGETNKSFTPTSNGDYKIEITQSSCILQSNCINVSTLAIETFENNSRFSIYPNPTNDNVNIKSNSNSGNFKIINLLGQTVRTFKINANIERRVYVGDLDEGIYFIKQTNSYNTSKTLIIKK